MKAINDHRGFLHSVFTTEAGRTYLCLATWLLIWFIAPTVFAEDPAGVDPFGDIGEVATNSLTLVFNVIGVILVLVGLGLFLSAAVNIIKGRSTAGDLMLSFVVAGALVLIGIAFVAYGISAVSEIGTATAVD